MGELPSTGSEKLSVQWVSSYLALQHSQAVACGQVLMDALWTTGHLLQSHCLEGLPLAWLEHHTQHPQAWASTATCCLMVYFMRM